MKPAIPIFTGNVVDSSSGAIKRIRRHVTRPDSSAASSADPARVDRIAVNPPDTYLRQCNPWVRLCEFILPWRLLNDINGSKDSSGAPAVEEMPVLYRTVDDYVARWEAVLLAELKASVLSGITDDTFRNVRTVQLVEFSEARPVGSSLVKLSYRPIEKDPKISSRPGRDFGVMDLLLISRDVLCLGDFARCQDRVRLFPPHMLCLVASNDRIVVGSALHWKQLSASKPLSGDITAVRSSITCYIYSLGSITSFWREFSSVFEVFRLKFSEFLLWGGHQVSGESKISTIFGSIEPHGPPSSSISELDPYFFGGRFSSVRRSSGESTIFRSGVAAPLLQWVASQLNSSQMNAIRCAALAVDRVMAARDLLTTSAGCVHDQLGSSSYAPFTLIQGPPGTGKTTTLLALLNIIHVKEYAVYFENAVSVVLGEDGLLCRNRHLRQVLTDVSTQCGASTVIGDHSSASSSVDVTQCQWITLVMSLSKFKPRLLVTAPSNVALDNILHRIMESGFRDGNGNVFFPNILRIGAGATSENVKAVTMEAATESFLQTDDLVLRQQLQKAKNCMIQEIKELFHIQTILLNMRVAFQSLQVSNASTEISCEPQPFYAPSGWELRISFEGAMPYWVDHANKLTQAFPPALCREKSISKNVDSRFSFFVLDAMPEYILYTTRLVALVESLELRNIKCRRMSLHLNRIMIGGNNGPNLNVSNSRPREVSGARQLIESSVLDEANIVFTTLNGSGHPSLDGSAPFPILVVDEAAQCTEPSVLIPMRRGCEHIILVGDPKQLPATVFSANASAKKIDRSLFERLTSLGCISNLLNVQYRMAPEIAFFPNNKFYEGKLVNGANVCRSNYLPDFLQPGYSSDKAKPKLRPLTFFNLKSSAEKLSNSKSRSNPEEVLFCLNLVKYVIDEANKNYQKPVYEASDSAQVMRKLSIGVITPYAEQVREFNRVFTNHGIILGPSSLHNCQVGSLSSDSSYEPVRKKLRTDMGSRHAVGLVGTHESYSSTNGYIDIEINTVDGFQGKEKDCIIISCVRANDSTGIGFLSDIRRMNVALTRAKFGLFVVGHADTLRRHNELWRNFVLHSMNVFALVDVSSAHQNISEVLSMNIAACCSSSENKIVDDGRLQGVVSHPLEDGELEDMSDSNRDAYNIIIL